MVDLHPVVRKLLAEGSQAVRARDGHERLADLLRRQSRVGVDHALELVEQAAGKDSVERAVQKPDAREIGILAVNILIPAGGKSLHAGRVDLKNVQRADAQQKVRHGVHIGVVIMAELVEHTLDVVLVAIEREIDEGGVILVKRRGEAEIADALSAVHEVQPVLFHIRRRFGRVVRDAGHILRDEPDELPLGKVGVRGEIGIRRLIIIERAEILPRVRLHRFTQRRGIVGRKIAPVARLVGIVGIVFIADDLCLLVVEIHQLAVECADLLGLLVIAEIFHDERVVLQRQLRDALGDLALPVGLLIIADQSGCLVLADIRAQRGARGAVERVGECGAERVVHLVENAVELPAGVAERFIAGMGVEIDIGEIVKRVHLGILRHQPVVKACRLFAVRRFAEPRGLVEKLRVIVDVPRHIGIVHVGVDAVGRGEPAGLVLRYRHAETGGERIAHAAVAADCAGRLGVIRTAAEDQGKHGRRKEQRYPFFHFHLHHPFPYYTIPRRK